jgi:hypothetical protein
LKYIDSPQPQVSPVAKHTCLRQAGSSPSGLISGRILILTTLIYIQNVAGIRAETTLVLKQKTDTCVFLLTSIGFKKREIFAGVGGAK